MVKPLHAAIAASYCVLKALELAGVTVPFATLTGLVHVQTHAAHLSVSDALAVVCIFCTLQDWASHAGKR